MKKSKVTILFMFLSFLLSAQEVYQSFHYGDGHSIIPKKAIQLNDNLVIPLTITKNKNTKAALLYLDSENAVAKVLHLHGENDYVINQIVKSSDNTLLIAAEGYSDNKQESLYFIELENGGIKNEFRYNENGNELDPFAIAEAEANKIFVGGFIKSRKLISNSFYNMYSEEQMLYFGLFEKSGKKIWSRGITIKGFEKGICNKILKIEDGYILLCHAHKIGGLISPFIIRLNKAGNVISIINLSSDDNENILSDLTSDDNKLYGVGTVRKSSIHYVYTLQLDRDLQMIKVNEFQSPFNLNLSSVELIDNAMKIYGSAITTNSSYDYVILEHRNGQMNFHNFGTSKFDNLVGRYRGILIGNSFGVNKEHTSSLVLLKEESKNSYLLKETEISLKIKKVKDFEIINSFEGSTLNPGVGKIEIKNITKSFISN